MVSITVPPQTTTDPSSGGSLGGFNVSPSTTTLPSVSYVFDAVLSLDHDQTLTKTHHPVQTGASISSHAFIEPARLVMSVLMSDVAGSYTAGVNQTSAPYVQTWKGSTSKSVSAYQQMLALQSQRVPLTVTTRLRTYQNMLITRVSPREEARTITGARFQLEFEQLFIANTQTTPVSTRPNDTASTGLGPVNTQPVPTAVDDQFGVHAYEPSIGTVTNNASTGPGTGDTEVPFPPDLNNGTIPTISDGVPGYLDPKAGPGEPTFTPQYPNSVNAVDVPGAGDYSSVNTNSLQQIPGL